MMGRGVFFRSSEESVVWGATYQDTVTIYYSLHNSISFLNIDMFSVQLKHFRPADGFVNNAWYIGYDIVMTGAEIEFVGEGDLIDEDVPATNELNAWRIPPIGSNLGLPCGIVLYPNPPVRIKRQTWGAPPELYVSCLIHSSNNGMTGYETSMKVTLRGTYE